MLAFKDIAKHYVGSLSFIFDLVAAIPLYLFQTEGFHPELVQITKLLSIWKVSLNISHSEFAKVFAKLIGMILSLMMYINFSTCLLYYIAEIDKVWLPPVGGHETPEQFYSLPKKSRYLHTLYAAILVLTGNEITPVGDLHIALACILTILGSLIIANIFGTFAVVVTALNRKNQKF